MFHGRFDMTEFTVHALFPIPVCVFEYKADVKLENFLRRQTIKSNFTDPKTRQQIAPVKKHYGSHSDDIRVLRNPECADLRKFILNNCKIVGNTVLGYNAPEYIDVLSWISIKSPGEEHVPHIHPNSFISGVFYFDANVEECPILFSDPGVVATKQNTLNLPREKESESTFATETVVLDIRQGELVLFPSYLKHMVETNRTNSNRYSLAFNVVPRYSVGTPNELTFFNYGDAM